MKLIKGWYLPANDTHFEQYITDEGYQEVHRKAILDFIKEQKGELGNALDIGAHVGFWLKDMCKEFKQVYAFEPINAVRDCIHHNVKSDNYKLLPCIPIRSLKSAIFKILSKHHKMTNLSPFGLKIRRIVLIFHAEFDFNGFEPYFIEKREKTKNQKISEKSKKDI